MVRNLTEQTLGMVPSLGALTNETLDMVRRLGANLEVGCERYLIRPTPKQLRDTGEWTLEIHIAREHGGERHEQLCIAANTFTTRDEAVARGIQFGRDIIDGKVSGCSVADL